MEEALELTVTKKMADVHFTKCIAVGRLLKDRHKAGG